MDSDCEKSGETLTGISSLRLMMVLLFSLSKVTAFLLGAEELVIL
jgi:hypothetical protein